MEPNFFQEAIKDVNWRVAMAKEIKAFKLNHT